MPAVLDFANIGQTSILPPAKKIIEMKGLQLVYPAKGGNVTALENVDLDIHEHDFVCLLGPSGCGKTSILKILAGYERQSNGSVILDGKQHLKPDADVGVVFQHANLFPWLSIRENVEFSLKMRNVPKADRTVVVDEHLQEVNLLEYAHLFPHQLSGGMKQRAAIARSLVANPKVILMDEPFAALDAITRETLQHSLRDVWKHNRTTVLFITHDVDEALALATRIVVLSGSPGTVVYDQANPLYLYHEKGQNIRKHPQYSEIRDHLISLLSK